MSAIELRLADEDATTALGQRVAAARPGGRVAFLH